MRVNKLIRVFRYRVVWLFIRPWEFWIGAAALGVTAAVSTLGNETALLFYGYVLQSLGLFIAAASVLSNERLFELPRLSERVRKWWMERRGRTVSAFQSGSWSILGSDMTAHSRQPRPDSTDLQQNFDGLWFNQAQIDADMTDLYGAMRRENLQLKAELDKERRANLERTAELRKTLATATVGTPITAYFGVFLVLIGSALTTFSDLIAS